MLVGPAIGEQHLPDAIKFCSGFSDRARVLARDQHMHVSAERLRGRERFVGRVLKRFVVVLGREERCHQMMPASLCSLSTSSATVLTFTPDLRPAGSVVLSTSSRGAISTP